MFKNTTRRGLAIGAAIAIAFSGLVTSPAQAAGEVVLAPSAGTTYNTFVTEGFTLQASMAPGQNPATAGQLKYKIDKAAGATVSYAVSTSAPVAGDTTFSASSTTLVVAAAGASGTTQNFIRLNVDGANTASSTVDVTVTAFVDSNNNSTLDAGEFNTPQTVSFKKYSDVATVVAITTPAQLDVTVSGTVAFTGINTSQVQSARGVVVVVNGTSLTSVSGTAGTFATAVSPALAAASTISAFAVVGADHKVGANAATVTVAKNTVGAITASAVAGDNARNASAGAVDARLNSAFAVQANVKATSTGSAVAGAAVTVAVDALGLSATKTLSLNGTVYTDSAKLPTALAVTSDASGNAVVNVVTAGFAASSTVSFVFKSQNQSADALVVTNKTAVYTATAAGTGFQTVTLSGAISVALTVADQWKVAAPSNYRVVVSYDGTTKYLPLAAGAVTATFTGTSSANAGIDVTVDAIQTQSAVTGNWSNESGATTTSGAVKVKSTAAAAAFSTAPTHSPTTSIARATASPKAGYLSPVTITGVTNHAGQSVVVSSTGVMFSNAAQDTAAVANTITTTADGNGNFTVSAYVTKAGAATITYLAGTATASTTVTAAANDGTKGTVLTIVSVDTILPGKTLVATVKLVDEHGNPVPAGAGTPVTESFSVTVTGLGFVGTLPTKLNASGEATVTVLLGSADEGSVVITATYDADAAGTAKAAITTTKTVAVAPAVASEVNAVVGSFNGRWAVRVENAKGSAVSIKVGGKWYKATATSDNFVFSRKSKVGATVLVKVWVAGDLQNEQTITVK
jgi:hypothetical protein